MDKDFSHLWDCKAERILEISFQLHIDYIQQINEDLNKKNRDIRASYMMFSQFIDSLVVNPTNRGFVKQAKILLRKDKIKKIIERI